MAGGLRVHVLVLVLPGIVLLAHVVVDCNKFYVVLEYRYNTPSKGSVYRRLPVLGTGSCWHYNVLGLSVQHHVLVLCTSTSTIVLSVFLLNSGRTLQNFKIHWNIKRVYSH